MHLCLMYEMSSDDLFSPLQSELQSDPKVINDIIALALHDALTYDKVGFNSDCVF